MSEGKRTVTLGHPVMGPKGELVSELTFPEPENVTLGQLGILDEAEGDMSRTAYLVHVLANIPLSSAKDIRWPDLKKINEVMADFLG